MKKITISKKLDKLEQIKATRVKHDQPRNQQHRSKKQYVRPSVLEINDDD